MFAVIKTGGKQYRVTEGQTLMVEKLPASAGDSIDFDQVLMLSSNDAVAVGSPCVDGAKVKAQVLEHGRSAKVSIIKFKRRKHHLKRQGHRQHFTKVKVLSIEQ